MLELNLDEKEIFRKPAHTQSHVLQLGVPCSDGVSSYRRGRSVKSPEGLMQMEREGLRFEGCAST